jgi:hypothetical protein
VKAPRKTKKAASQFVATAAAASASSSTSAMPPYQRMSATKRPVANGLALVLRMRTSRSRSYSWLNAPAAEDAISVASPSTSTCQGASSWPGITTMPVTAQTVIRKPSRTLAVW